MSSISQDSSLVSQPSKRLYRGWQYRQIVQLFFQNLGDCLLGAEYYHRAMAYGARKRVSAFKPHVQWHNAFVEKWLNHKSFDDYIGRFFVNADSSDKVPSQKLQRVRSHFRDGTTKKIFNEIVLVIDSGGLYDQYTMDTKTERYLDLHKFFTSYECAENKINLTSVLYYNLGLIVKDYINNIAATSLSESEVNMIVICCMLLVGQGGALTQTATPFLLNSLLLMATSEIDASMPALSRICKAPVRDQYQPNWSMGLLKIAQSEHQSQVIESMTNEEKNAYGDLIKGGKIEEGLFKRLRKLSIMMLAEGVIVKNRGTVKMLVGEYQEKPIGLEEKLQSFKSQNGFIKGKQWNRWAVWLPRAYLAGTFVFSIYVVVGNIANRENVFERLTDGLTAITALWFTVFGLIKLQSDDENVIRNLVLGNVPIQHEDELVKYLKTDIESLKVALCRIGVQSFGWLSGTDCCYVKGQMKGKIEILGGLQATSCDRAGLLEVDEGVVFDLVNNMFGMGSKNRERLHVEAWARSTEKWLIVNRVPSNCVVAGNRNEAEILLH